MSDTEQKEDTTPPAAAEQKITKPKAPGRVAAGKKLAELNKKNKAKKAPVVDDAWSDEEPVKPVQTQIYILYS